MNVVMDRAPLREIVLGLWKIHILQHASDGGVVGNHLLQELRNHGYDASPGTLYPLLHRMERNGWLQSQAPEAGPKAARTYELTPAGGEILQLILPFINELHRELSERPERAAASSAVRGAIE